jgi:hypothetical protein
LWQKPLGRHHLMSVSPSIRFSWRTAQRCGAGSSARERMGSPQTVASVAQPLDRRDLPAVISPPYADRMKLIPFPHVVMRLIIEYLSGTAHRELVTRITASFADTRWWISYSFRLRDAVGNELRRGTGPIWSAGTCAHAQHIPCLSLKFRMVTDQPQLSHLPIFAGGDTFTMLRPS